LGLGDRSRDIEDGSAGGHGIPNERGTKGNIGALSDKGLCSTYCFCMITLLVSQFEGQEKERNKECPNNPISLDTKGRETNCSGKQIGNKKIGGE